MSAFTVNPYRSDPYKNYRFHVVIDGKVVAAMLRVSSITRETQVVEYRDPSTGVTIMSPGETTYLPIVLERGITHDKAFEDWSEAVGAGGVNSLKNLRKDIVIELMNECGQTAMAWKLYKCWPSEYTSCSELTTDGVSIAVERIVLQYERFERDKTISEPVQP